jgi:hypothetical protein
MAVGAGLRACPIKILFLKVKMRIAFLTFKRLTKCPGCAILEVVIPKMEQKWN